MDTMEILSKKLIDFKFPKNKTRENVLKDGDVSYEGFVSGYVKTRFRGINNCGYNFSLKKNKKGCDECYELGKKLGEELIPDPDFKFSSIQFNKNYKMKKHVDKNNVGKSYIIGLGDYEGGELLVYFDGKDHPPTKIDIKNKFYTFNGNKYWHEIADFTGNRISLVYYNIIKDGDRTKEKYIEYMKTFEYVVCISSKDNYKNIEKECLDVLLEEIDSEKIFIFVENMEEFKKYKKEISKDKYNQIVIGNRKDKNGIDLMNKFFIIDINKVIVDEKLFHLDSDSGSGSPCKVSLAGILGVSPV